MAAALERCERMVAYCHARARIALSPIRRERWKRQASWWQARLPYLRRCCLDAHTPP